MKPRHGPHEGRWIFNQADHAFTEKIQLGLKLLEFSRFLRLAPGIDDLAEAAGMLAAKRLFERYRDWLTARERDSHTDPGDGLQEKPMSPCGKNDGQHHKPSAEPSCHSG